MQVRSLVRELRSHMPCSRKKQNIRQRNTVTNSTSTLKLVHIKKKKNSKLPSKAQSEGAKKTGHFQAGRMWTLKGPNLGQGVALMEQAIPKWKSPHLCKDRLKLKPKRPPSAL